MVQNKIAVNRFYHNKSKYYLGTVQIIGLSGLLLSGATEAVISAHTIFTIEGTKPYIQLIDGSGNVTGDLMTLEQLVGFTMPGSSGTIQKEASDSTTNGGAVIVAPAGMKFSDVVTLVKADGVAYGIVSANAADSDGDANNNAGTIIGNMKATWYNDYSMVTDLDEELSDCGGPYKLIIEANNVSVETAYGDPKSNTYGSQAPITYTFHSSGFPKLCYIMTGSPTAFPTSGAPGENSKYPATGYNPDLWVRFTGFSIEKINAAGLAYPTTGFNKAKLMFIASGYSMEHSSIYRCTTTSPWIELSSRGGVGQNCVVSYNTVNKPTTPAVINLEYYDGTSWTQKDSYTIPAPTTWAVVKGLYAYADNALASAATAFPAASMCKDGTTTSVTTLAEANTYLFTRQELSNVPSATGTPVYNINEQLARDIDGTFAGEWGSLNETYYPGSGLATNDASFTWTGESFSDYQQVVYSHYAGYSYNYGLRSQLTTICR